MQRDVGAARRFVQHLDRELAAAVRFPAHTLIRLLSGAARRDGNLVGHDERGIETDPELADQVRVLLLVAAQLGKEFPGPGFRDRAQIADDLVSAHADAVVADRDGPGILVVTDAYLQVGIVLEQLVVMQRLEAQFVAGIGSV